MRVEHLSGAELANELETFLVSQQKTGARGQKQRDNSTYRQKVTLRRFMLAQMEQVSQRAQAGGLPRLEPVVMETHGGVGAIYHACYAKVPVRQGVVFERDPLKAGLLARQRPGAGWSVYEADCVQAIKAGAGSHLAVNVLDVDPYGEPWPVLDAFFDSIAEGRRSNLSRLLYVVVNDGMRQNTRVNRAWKTGSLLKVVEKIPNHEIDKRYLEVCEMLMTEKAALAGYSLTRFVGYYCGHADQMTHYLAELLLELD